MRTGTVAVLALIAVGCGGSEVDPAAAFYGKYTGVRESSITVYGSDPFSQTENDVELEVSDANGVRINGGCLYLAKVTDAVTLDLELTACERTFTTSMGPRTKTELVNKGKLTLDGTSVSFTLSSDILQYAQGVVEVPFGSYSSTFTGKRK